MNAYLGLYVLLRTRQGATIGASGRAHVEAFDRGYVILRSGERKLIPIRVRLADIVKVTLIRKRNP